MTTKGARGEHVIELGDVIDVLRDYEDNVFDAVLCDPPYGLSFMGKRWDYDVPSVELWREVLRVCKPGAALLSFGGSRTFHRVTVNIEDAGFEIRDCLTWLYAKGFPKSQNVSKALDKAAGATREVVGIAGKSGSKRNVMAGGFAGGEYMATAPATDIAKAWDGYGTALKPAWEPIVLGRKPLDGTMVENVTRWGVGALAIDACRIGNDGGTTKANCPKGDSNGIYGHGINGACDVVDIGAGRWPANLLLDEEAGAILDAEVGERKSTPYRENKANGAVLPLSKRTAGGYGESGGPSRFFFSSKVSTREREAGCQGLPLRSAGEVTDREDGSAGLDSPGAGAGRGGGARNFHPTLKPIALTEYLARLVMPPSPGAILVPFAGSGSEMIGALRAGWPAVVGIERESQYVEIAKARLAHWVAA